MRKYALLIVISLCFVACTTDDLDDMQDTNLETYLSETNSNPKIRDWNKTRFNDTSMEDDGN